MIHKTKEEQLKSLERVNKSIKKSPIPSEWISTQKRSYDFSNTRTISESTNVPNKSSYPKEKTTSF